MKEDVIMIKVFEIETAFYRSETPIGDDLYYRYMGRKEFEMYCAGVPIIGRRQYKAHTNSMGMCFLGSITPFLNSKGDSYEFTPQECYRFLKGVVDGELLVCYRTNKQPRESYGMYADPITCGLYDRITIKEYNFDSYSKDDFELVCYQWVCDSKVYYV